VGGRPERLTRLRVEAPIPVGSCYEDERLALVSRLLTALEEWPRLTILTARNLCGDDTAGGTGRSVFHRR